MIDPVLFNLGIFEIRWYSVFILIAVGVSYLLIASESKRFKLSKEFMFNLLFWALIMGIIGARIYYVLFNLSYYSKSPIEILKVWHGGLAIHGGIIFGLVTIIIYTKKYKANTFKILDIMAPALLIAQAIGRWGNFFNREAYGVAVSYKTLVNMKIIPQFIIDNMEIKGAYHLPMFYFESIACIIGFLILMFIRRRKYVKVSQIFASYLIIYGAIRFVIEIFRTDALLLGNIKIAQVVSIVMICAGIVINLAQMKKLKLENLYNKNDEDIEF